MPIGDPLYRLTDVETRLRQMENSLRATVPGNRPSLGPDHPAAVVTSAGQVSPLADSDAQSRALNTAIENAFAAVESVQDVKTDLTAVNFGGGVTQTIRSTVIRPEPVVGDTYHLRAGGFINNQSGGARTVSFKYALGPHTPIVIYTVIVGDLQEVVWWVHVQTVIIIAGASAQYTGISAVLSTDSVVGPVTNVATPILATVSYLTTLNAATNLVGAPTLALSATADLASANLFINPTFYLVERKSFRVG